MISDAVDFSKKNPNARFEIQGFADGTGNLEYNQSLAKTRASEVRKGLLNAGIPADRIALVKPAEAVSSSEDTMQDRKVELRVFRPAE